MPTTVTIIPGTGLMSAKQASGQKFCRENQTHISKATNPKGFVMKQAADGGKQCGKTVNGKHPQRGSACKLHIPTAQRVHCSKNDFHAPAHGATTNEISNKGLGMMY